MLSQKHNLHDLEKERNTVKKKILNKTIIAKREIFNHFTINERLRKNVQKE